MEPKKTTFFSQRVSIGCRLAESDWSLSEGTMCPEIYAVVDFVSSCSLLCVSAILNVHFDTQCAFASDISCHVEFYVWMYFLFFSIGLMLNKLWNRGHTSQFLSQFYKADSIFLFISYFLYWWGRISAHCRREHGHFADFWGHYLICIVSHALQTKRGKPSEYDMPNRGGKYCTAKLAVWTTLPIQKYQCMFF